MYGIWRTWELANSFKNIWVMFHNMFLACDLLVGPLLLYFWYMWGILQIGWHTYFCLRVALSGQLLGNMYLYGYWHLLSLPGVIIIRLALGGRKSSLDLGCIRSNASLDLQDTSILPSLVAT